ncbi:MAG: hypothetical protein L6R42_000336 [Xanthoria sp. 1 TBL-2021]|nr:MAG: hypothetical protein L6R42_000336 [Xanthoria sp. 1 TBL-2021]
MSTDIEDSDSQETFNWRHDMNEGPAKAKVMKRTQHPGVGNKRPAKRPQTEWKACQDQMTAAANIRHHVRQVDLEMVSPCAEKDSELLNAAKSIAAKHVALADLVKARPSVAGQPHSNGDILEPFADYTSAVKHLAAVTDSDSRSMRQLQDDNKRLQQLLATNEDKQQDLQRQISSLGQGKIDADKVREKESTGYQELKKQWKNMVGNNTNLQHRAEGLELRISELERERDKKKATAEDYRLQYDDLLKRAHGLRKRKDMLQVDFDAALKKGAGFEQQITDLAGEKNRLDKTIQSMEASLKQRDEEIQASTSTHDTLVHEHERQIADLIEEQARFNKTIHASLEQKDEKVRASTLQYNNLVRKHERQTRKVETMYAELFEAAARENQLELDLQQAKAGSKDFSDKATAVEAKNNRLLLDLEELESRLKKAKSDADRDKSQLQRNLTKSNLQRQNALALAAQHEQTIATQATEKNGLKGQLQDLQTRLNETTASLDQKELQLQQGITEFERRNKYSMDAIKKHERMSVETTRQNQGLELQLQNLQTQYDELATNTTQKESEFKARIAELDILHQSDLVKLKDREQRAAAAIQQGRACELKVQSLQTALEQAADDTGRRESQLLRDIKRRDFENEELKKNLKESIEVVESSSEEIARLQTLISDERDSFLQELKTALNITPGPPNATLARLGIPQDVAPLPRTTPYQGRLDQNSILGGRGVADIPRIVTCSTDATADENDALEEFTRAYSFQFVQVVLCLDHEGLMDTCVRLLGDIWVNLETTIISPPQMSAVATPLACMVNRVVTATLPDMAVWLAAQLANYLLAWGFPDLESSDISHVSAPGDNMLGSLGRHCLTLDWQVPDSTKGQPVGPTQPLSISAFLPSDCTRFDAAVFGMNVENEEVKVCMCRLPHLDEIIWALEKTDGCYLIWHGKTTACTVVTYGLAHLVRLESQAAQEAIWMYPQDARKVWDNGLLARGWLLAGDAELVAKFMKSL